MTATTYERQTEAARLDALLGYRILDTPPEQAYDDLVELAAAVCYTPVAGVAFVDADRAWLKAKCGVDVSEFPRDVSLATEAIEQSDVFAVRDALEGTDPVADRQRVGERLAWVLVRSQRVDDRDRDPLGPRLELGMLVGANGEHVEVAGERACGIRQRLAT